MSLNLLLVEDDALSRRNLTIYLQQFSHKVVEANSGEDAVKLMSRVNFDVVISDFRLPGRINGMEVLRRHAQMLPGRRLILLTAFGSDDIRAEAEALGAFYREKPIAMDDLLDSIETPFPVSELGQAPPSQRKTAIGSQLDESKTEREVTKDELKQSEELFRLLVEGVQDYAIYMLDPAGIVTTWNAGAERIKGYTAQEIIARHFSCFYRPVDIREGRPYRALE